MTEPNDPAFESPILGERENGSAYAYSHGGLTKREYFAGMAMQGLLNSAFQDGSFSCDYSSIAMSALSAADALIVELSKDVANDE